MANEKISDMPSILGTDVAGADQVPIVHSGANNSITINAWQLIPLTQIVSAGGNFAVNNDGSASFGAGNLQVSSAGVLTVSAAVSFDSTAITSNGSGKLTVANLVVGSMPASDPHVAGQLYSVAGVVHVSAG